MNRLANEASPYLRQHADNPVDWYPWGPEAFEAAQHSGRPILLSIGYSACHWCHVMAHESFEDDATAAVLNELFVNIKVDREERPDVDAIYMEATVAMSGHGGWPMTAFLTPDREPFFCGTYFPKVSRGGGPTFLDVCRAVDDAWRNRRDDVVAQAGELTRHIRSDARFGEPAQVVEPSELGAATQRVLAAFDEQWGGFGGAPKFPSSMTIDLLLRIHRSHGYPDALAAARHSLDAMCAGGIWDHLGGGFSRYSVDERWLVPHFEKMLYDNALLLRPYLHSWSLDGADDHLVVVEEIINYVLCDLSHPDGGWYSAEDADSEGEEGKFYLWTPTEIAHAIGNEQGAELINWYRVTESGNFEGSNILHRPIGGFGRPANIDAARLLLFDARRSRVRPGLDDKVLTEWNALFLAGLCEAAAMTGREDWRDAAVRNAEFLVTNLRRSNDERWMRAWQAETGARHLGYAADYTAVIDAFTRLYELTGSVRWLEVARNAAEDMLGLFYDDATHLLWTTGSDAESLLTRPRDLQDNATPSAQSTAAVALIRLAPLVDDERFTRVAEGMVSRLLPLAVKHPLAFARLLDATHLLADGLVEIVICGDRPDLVEAVHRRWLPNAVVSWGDRLVGPLWEGRPDGAGYVCRNFTCGLPAVTVEELEAQLS